MCYVQGQFIKNTLDIMTRMSTYISQVYVYNYLSNPYFGWNMSVKGAPVNILDTIVMRKIFFAHCPNVSFIIPLIWFHFKIAFY